MTSMVQFGQTMNRINSVSALLPSANAEPLTPDSIILMCASRLRSLDDQLQTNLNKQQAYRSTTSNVNAAQTVLAGDATTGGLFDADGIKRVNDSLDAAIKAAPEGDIKNRLVQLKADFSANAADGGMKKEECASYAQQLQDISKDINSSAELDMISVNSLMSQRQTAVQLFNNLLTSQGETLKSIAASIGK